MDIRQSLGASSAKAPSFVHEFDGPIEATIAFTSENELGTTQPTAATIIWYHSLGDTERQIKGLQFHETVSGRPPFVVLLMNDDSFLLLKISQNGSSREQLVVNVIRLPDITGFAGPSIRVDFLQTSDGGDEYVDLKFVVAVCCGILGSKSLQSPGSDILMTIPQCQRLFALALFISVVRKRLPVNESLIKDVRSLSYVDNFWLELLSSSQCYGRLLWEEALVEQVHQEVRHWIHSAACQQLEAFMPLMATIDQDSDPESRDKKKRVVESISAWLEFTARNCKGKLSDLDTWGVAWDETWRLEWEKGWRAKWVDYKGVQTSLDQIESVPQVLPGDILSGYLAGRATISVSLVATAARIPDKSLLAMETTALMGSQGDQGGRSGSQDNACNWFGSWHSIRHPDSKQQGKWLPVWEAARNMAWALAWEDLEAGGRFTQETTHPSQQLIRPGVQRKYSANTQPLPIPMLLEERQAPWLSQQGPLSESSGSTDNFLQIAETQFQKLFKRSNQAHGENRPTFNKGIAEPDIRILSEVAWLEVSANGSNANGDPNSKVNEYIRRHAKRVFELLKAETNPALHSKLPHVDKWGEAFTAHWADVWRKSWEDAWTKVMLSTVSDFKEWRYQADSRPQDKVLMPDIGDLSSYKDLKEYLDGSNSNEDKHWRIRSALKASNLLRNVLSHSVPKCYQNVMKITYFPDRPLEFLSPSPNPKLKRIAQAMQQDREEQIQHGELQSKIKELISEKYTKRFPAGYEATQHIEEIWRLASHIDSNEEFLGTQDTNYDRLWGLAADDHPVLKRSTGGITWALRQWHKAADGVRRSVQRRGTTDSYTSHMAARR